MSDPTPAPIDERAIRAYRLQRLRRHLAEADVAGILLTDSVNLRYATGSRNMQVWTMHNICRYAFVATSGPVVLFDLPSSMHLSTHLETIDERRPTLAWDNMAVGERGAEMAGRWARRSPICPASRRGQSAPGPRSRRSSAARSAGGERGRRSRRQGNHGADRAVKSPEEIRAFIASLRTTRRRSAS
jgi:Xaa-Pro aminopeptidase